MILYKLIAGFIFLTFTSNCFSQEKYSYKAILTYKKIGKTFINRSINDTTWRTYLGTISDSKGKAKYYVIKEFNKIRAAATWHGHSNIFFFDRQNKLAARIDVSMPYNLPYNLNNNVFFFKYTEKGEAKVFKMKVGIPLPKTFCTRPDWCDLIIYE